MRHTRIAVIALTVAAIADGIVTTCALPPEWDSVRWLVPFIAIYGVVFWWLHHDSALHDYQPSALLKVGIVLVIMIFMPVYLFKSRPKGQRLRPIASFIGLVLLYGFVSGVVGSMLK